MRCSVAVLAVLLLVSAGLLGAEAGDCLRVWVDTRGQAAECKAVDVQAELTPQPESVPRR